MNVNVKRKTLADGWLGRRRLWARRDAARQARSAVVFTDGEELARLTFERGIRTPSEALRIPQFDTGSFEGE